jgi:transaldolase
MIFFETMQIFLDTAHLDDIKKYAQWGIVDGVTTNPSLVAKEGVDFKTRVQEICQVIPGPVSAEVISTTAAEMVQEARNIATWAPNVVVKIPFIEEGLKALSIISREGIRTNVTLIFSPAQAMLAAKAGATFVSPFAGRLDDIGEDGMAVVEDIVNIFRMHGIDTKVLAASIRTPQHVLQAMRMGADVVTLPPNLLDKMISHPLTNKGLEGFLKDWENMKK